jgi:Flp pilus assembly pilin Flp
MTGRMARCRWDEWGQTTSEYLMIAGLLTAIILGTTGIVVPPVRGGVVWLLQRLAVFVSSP